MAEPAPRIEFGVPRRPRFRRFLQVLLVVVLLFFLATFFFDDISGLTRVSAGLNVLVAVSTDDLPQLEELRAQAAPE